MKTHIIFSLARVTFILCVEIAYFEINVMKTVQTLFVHVLLEVAYIQLHERHGS